MSGAQVIFPVALEVVPRMVNGVGLQSHIIYFKTWVVITHVR